MEPQEQIPPVNPLPPVVVALAVLIIGIEIVFALGSRGLIGGPEAIGWRTIAIQEYGFNADIMAWMLQNGRFPIEFIKRFVTYIFVHGSFTHALFAAVMLLALGNFTAAALRPMRMLVLFLASAIFGALIYGFFAGPQQPWLIGAYPGIYGLIGCFTCVLWLQLGHLQAQRFAAFRLIGILMGLQLVFGVLFGAGRDWIADLAGFAFGFALSFLLVPGGWQRFLAVLRNEN